MVELANEHPPQIQPSLNDIFEGEGEMVGVIDGVTEIDFVMEGDAVGEGVQALAKSKQQVFEEVQESMQSHVLGLALPHRP